MTFHAHPSTLSFRTVTLLVALLLAASAATPVFAVYGFTPQAFLHPDFGTDGIFTDQDREPDFATDGAGVWIAVWTRSGSGDADLWWSRSADDGLTWNAPAPFNTNAATDSGDDGQPAIATDGSGNWIVVWASDDDLGPTLAGTDYDILYTRSTDHGLTWSAPAPLHAHATTDNLAFSTDAQPEIACDGGNTWVVAWVSEAVVLSPAGTGDSEILALRSTDDGATWGSLALASPNSATDNEPEAAPFVATDGTGVWIVASVSQAIAFDSDVDFDVFFMRSTDDAATWSSGGNLSGAAAVSGIGNHSCSIAADDGSGTWMAVWGTDSTAFDANVGDGDIVFATSTDFGATWSTPATIDAAYASDTPFDSRPSVAWNAATDEWGVVWQSQEIGAEDLKMAASINDGATWGPGQTVSNTGDGQEKVPVIAASPGSGVWMIVWESSDGFGIPITDDDIMAMRSAALPVELSGFTLE